MNEIQVKNPVILNISKLCEEIGSIPKNSILFGMGTDEKPVLYDVSKASAPNVVIWDRLEGQGLRIIKTAIEFILKHKVGDKTEFIVLSNHTKEWEKLTESELGVWSKNECIAIVPFWHVVADQVIFALSEWCRGKHGAKSSVLLFVDGLENLSKMGEESKRSLLHVLKTGRSKNIHVIGTAKSQNRNKLFDMLECFEFEIYGKNAIEFFEIEQGLVLFWTPSTNI